MKTAYLLFGLASACVSGAPSETQYPLCGKDGAPACGNIGQVGRNEKESVAIARESRGTPIATTSAATSALAAAHASATGATAAGFLDNALETSRRMVPVLTRVLVGASSEIQRVSPLHRPLANHREEVVCGNVMGKGGRTRHCKTPQGHVIAVGLDENGKPVGEVHTYDTTP